MKYPAIKNELFITNRSRFCKELKPNSIAIFNSNDEMPRSADQTFEYRQNPDIFSLCGIDQEKTILIIYPDCPNPKFREVLFLRKTDEQIAIWEGHKYTMEEAEKASGIKTILWLDEFETIFNTLMKIAHNCYLNINEHERYSNSVPYKDIRFANEIKNTFPLHNFERSAPILVKLRTIKSEIEIDLIKTACSITEKGFRRLLGFVQPGVMEYEIEAEVSHEFLRNRATGHAYTPIVASGRNACVLHYIENNKECKDGDLLLLDIGAEYANYASDLSRTIPVNGKFSKRQKDVYNAVLRVMKGAISMLVPGTILEEYHLKVGLLMEEELIKLNLLNSADVKKQDPANPLYKKYFMHGTSHFMGIDVHDVGSRYEPMKEGMIFTCEPGIYILEENLGIRIENDILLTKEGPVDLMKSIPIEAEEIEDLMNNG